MDEEYSEGDEPRKVYTSPTTYVTRRDGQLVMVRNKKKHTRAKTFSLGRAILGEAFRIPRKTIWKESTMVPGESEESNPSCSPPGPTQQATGSFQCSAPQPMQTYEYKGRQLVLIPTPYAAARPTLQQRGYPYSYQNPYSNPWMLPGNIPTSTYNQFPSYSAYPPMFGAQTFVAPPPVVRPSSTTSPDAAAIPSTTNSAIEASTVVSKPTCAGCGRMRSSKYRHEHPLKPGESPPESYCKKCQQEATSSEESAECGQDSNEKEKKKKKKKTRIVRKKSKTKSRKERKASGLDSDTGSSKELAEFSNPGRKDKQATRDEYVTSGNYSDSIESRDSQKMSTNIHDLDYQPRRPPSPLLGFSRRPIQGIYSPKTYRRRESSLPGQRKINIETFGDTYNDQTRPERVGYRILRPAVDQVLSGENEELYRGRKTQPKSMHDNFEPKKYSRSRREVQTEDEFYRQMPDTERSHIDPKPEVTAMRCQGSSNRRRRERLPPADSSPPRRNYKLPISPARRLHDDETMLFTECYVYRPRLSHLPEEGWRKETNRHAYQPDLNSQTSSRQFEAKINASSYYHDDWNRQEQPTDHQLPRRIRPRDLEEYYGTRPVSRSSNTSPDRYCIGQRSSSRVETPLSSSLSQQNPPDSWLEECELRKVWRNTRQCPPKDSWYEESSQCEVTYPLGDQKSYIPRADKYMKPPSEDFYSEDSIATSNHRPPYVREATEQGTEKALVPSTHHSRERQCILDNGSESTIEMERLKGRHVTFDDVLDPFIISDEWRAERYVASTDRGERESISPKSSTEW